MQGSSILSGNKIHFKDKNGESFYLSELTYSLGVENADRLVNLINTIPHINWSQQEFIEKNEDKFRNKWELSLVVENSRHEIIGLLIAYIRKADGKHIFDSLYIHKFVISAPFQRRGIGTYVLQAYIYLAFNRIPWLFNISVQTNDEIENKGIIDFYKKNKFCEQYKIDYIAKIDILFLLTRDKFEGSDLIQLFENNNFDCTFISISHPRLKIKPVLLESPKLFFSTSNKSKQELNKYIFNNYNFEIILLSQNIKLTEPQVDKASLIDERNLVESPLKLASRFIEKTSSIPFYVEDTMLFIEYFNKDFNENPELPGHDTKRWWRQLGDNGIVKILGSSTKRRARFVSQIGAYIGKGKYIYGRGSVEGTISMEPRISEVSLSQVPGTYPFFFHSIFIPYGSEKTLAEMNLFEFSQHDYVRKCVQNFIDNISSEEVFTNEINLFNYLKINEK